MKTSVLAGFGFLLMAGTAIAQSPFTVYFGFDEAELDSQARQTVANAADAYEQEGTAEITVTGHTDTVGSPSYNQQLSERRAESVRYELVRLGVPDSAITVRAEGQTDLAVPTGDGVREPDNRRVVIAVEGTEPAPVAQAEPDPAPTTMAAAEPETDRQWLAGGMFSLGGLYGLNLRDDGDENGDGSDKTSHLAGLNLSFDYGLTDFVSLSLEQAVFYNFLTDDDGFGGRSAGGVDFTFGRGTIFPYVGGNIGYIYGSGIEDDVFAGPEIGVNLGPVNTKIAYDMPFGRSWDDGIVVATVGLGIRF